MTTQNVDDFKSLPDGLEAQSADEFLCNLFDLDAREFTDILREQAGDLIRPPVTFEELLESLSRIVPDLVALVRAQTQSSND